MVTSRKRLNIDPKKLQKFLKSVSKNLNTEIICCALNFHENITNIVTHLKATLYRGNLLIWQDFLQSLFHLRALCLAVQPSICGGVEWSECVAKHDTVVKFVLGKIKSWSGLLLVSCPVDFFRVFKFLISML